MLGFRRMCPSKSFKAFAFLFLFTGSVQAATRPTAPLPTITVTADDTQITNSCIVEIPPGVIIEDRNTNGVIHIAAHNISVFFTDGSRLRGAADGALWDAMRGVGVSIEGRKNVTIENLNASGYKNGIVAIHADGLIVTECKFTDNYRQRLKSTRQVESPDDWLFPHNNDQRKWRDQYGGAICVEESRGVTIRRNKVRRGQNGIILDRVNESGIYDNDCSFLSGWGLAMWMSSSNQVSRNAFDFCVRGHVEDVYNRGQDSAGILAFEQCNENWFIENSATHGGDGFFGFAGHASIGETWWKAERERVKNDANIKPPEDLVNLLKDTGCNNNILIGNDFSYASAHGVEITFSEGNQIIRNRITDNAICGFWGGYSSGTLIAENDFARNGGMAYGLERGAINMEHAADNLILRNNFLNDRCAIHLWWDDDGALMRYPGVAANERGVVGNIIAGNSFSINKDVDFKRLGAKGKLVVLQLRDSSQNNLRDNHYFKNDVNLKHPLAIEFLFSDSADVLRTAMKKIPSYKIPKYERLGVTQPVGARRLLRDRRFITMEEWGPRELDRAGGPTKD